MRHPLFSIKNPNKVRALLGAFAHGNPLGFHQSSGESYVFVADQVLALDALNPQVAARLAKSFARWRRYRAPLGQLMQAQLERILATSALSKDVYEVVSKTLA